ncbi:MAG TPA: zinc-ribbon domain containing protein [Pyrinomonadaceae bacterium]|nr:zinc-ribbon domain containing protein [Pyrinomonadaceae bacterium]
MSDNKLDHHQINGVSQCQEDEILDKKMLCIDCNSEFIWAVGEQIFFRDKGLTNPPKRCRDCKNAKNERLAAVFAAREAGFKQRIEIAVHCAKCNSYTTVPFYPSQGRPVLCRSCFLEKNASQLKSNK